uniref:Uncharacterized protein n=1 Tax=Setaria viridis TaxID=4556 RepID=A0A4U6SSV0_SETVI|nr:hypothetical protein SEVIR_9G131300v2 [Setaria viridis]
MKLLCNYAPRAPHAPGPRQRDPVRRWRAARPRRPRDVSFRELTRRLEEMASGADVRAIRHRLSVTCDKELAHMRDEYDRLCATRPAARFRGFVTTAAANAGSGGGFVHSGRSSASGLPPLAPKIRRVQSEQAQLHRRPAFPAPVRRVQSAQGVLGAPPPPAVLLLGRVLLSRSIRQCASDTRDPAASQPSTAYAIWGWPEIAATPSARLGGTRLGWRAAAWDGGGLGSVHRKHGHTFRRPPVPEREASARGTAGTRRLSGEATNPGMDDT